MKFIKRLIVSILIYLLLVTTGIFAFKSIKKANAIDIDVISYDNISDLTDTTWTFNQSITNEIIGGTKSFLFGLPSSSHLILNGNYLSLYFENNNVNYNYLRGSTVAGSNDLNPFGFFQYSSDNLSTGSGRITVYRSSDGWLNQNYRTITIIGGIFATNSDFILWMQQNATQQQLITQLTTPTITKTAYNQISWSTIQNAEYYEIYKNDELYDTTQDTFYNVDSLGNYQVIAVGDGENYENSELSNTISIISSQLTTPTISINNDFISWSNIQYATSYDIYLDNELIDTIYTNSYTITQNGNYQVKAVSNNVFFTNSNLSNTINVNYQYAKVTFYSKDNITELISIENWLIGQSIWDFSNSIYTYQGLLTLIANDSNHDINDFVFGNYSILFNDNFLFENSFFGDRFIISSDIDIYYKIYIPYYPTKVYDNYSLSSSNSIDLFNTLGDNLINNISLSTIDVKFDYLISNQTSIITSDFLIDNYNLGDNFTIYIDSYGNEFYFDCVVTQNNSIYTYNNYLYRSNINSNTIIIPCMNFDDFVILNNGSYEFIGNLSNVTVTIPNTFFSSSFSYNQNMNFYYCNYIGFSFNIENFDTNVTTNLLRIAIRDTNNMFYDINYNFGSSHLVNYFDYLLINSDNFNNFLYDKTFLALNFTSLLATNGLSNTYNNKNDCITALENLSIKFSFGNPILYYYDTTDKTNSSTGTGLIPLNSSGLYKTDFEWYDVTAYIYNAIIYLVFDAPIISNITKLIYHIISLVLFVIQQIILLFSTVTNNIFIVGILGFLLLKFVINLLVK